MLDAVGKRYLVEHQEFQSDNGLTWFDRYSDGYIVQRGKSIQEVSNIIVTLMVEMRDKDYYCTCKRIGKADASTWPSSVSDLTTTQFSANPQGGVGFTWKVEGYAK